MRLNLLQIPLAVCRLPSNAAVPSWVSGPVQSVSKTPDELSIVTAAGSVPSDVQIQGPFKAFQVEGPIDFSSIGVLVALLTPLSAANISVFALSTYDTDYVLVKEGDVPSAIKALKTSGHEVSQL